MSGLLRVLRSFPARRRRGRGAGGGRSRHDSTQADLNRACSRIDGATPGTESIGAAARIIPRAIPPSRGRAAAAPLSSPHTPQPEARSAGALPTCRRGGHADSRRLLAGGRPMQAGNPRRRCWLARRPACQGGARIGPRPRSADAGGGPSRQAPAGPACFRSRTDDPRRQVGLRRPAIPCPALFRRGAIAPLSPAAHFADRRQRCARTSACAERRCAGLSLLQGGITRTCFQSTPY